jgi:signal peptidase II
MKLEKLIGFRPQNIFWVILISSILMDQISKLLIARTLILYESVVVIPKIFNLTLVHNDGIAFGLWGGNNFILGFIAILILLSGIWYARKLDWHLKNVNIIAALIIGGAVGNLIDRAQHGYVIDFLDFYINQHHWPAFNIADSCITISVIYILFTVWTDAKRSF